MPPNCDYPKKPPNPYHPFVGHSAGSWQCTASYGDSMVVGFAEKPAVDLKRRLARTHNCYETIF